MFFTLDDLKFARSQTKTIALPWFCMIKEKILLLQHMETNQRF